ncbi:MAG: bifunctional phosphopantothenoylcysteine decarboxylase/phosphopantothenate--cysteine ligase CoaBC [Bacteroidetes bacterium]|nr:bifunctional phosphopantothenoylcysteine decarboxylase/phosphopantothenate--cysteine ligase CoaBC [Bacteroidota bacterium]
MLKGKKILLGVTGGIAAYKAAFLVRLFVKEEAEVKVVMTNSAKEFITPLTLSVLSKNPVQYDFSVPGSGEWNNHVELGMWADVMLIAPATADTMAKMAHGICDNLLLAVYLSAKCPVYVAPAMDRDMLKHPSTQQNMKQLVSFGNKIISPSYGELASGLIGEGRMEEPETIFETIQKHFSAKLPLSKKKILVTAGPTYEKIDAVRFIGNHSSGKMGFAIAEELASQGADVILVTGPSSLTIQNNSILRRNVESADEMYRECMKHFDEVDGLVMSAAVADYKPEKTHSGKIKKHDQELQVKLVQTKDILSELGKKKKKNQFLVGFALETDNEVANAKEKIKSKNLDLVVLNSLKDTGAGFEKDTNKITIIDRNFISTEYSLKSKMEVAKDIVAAMVSRMKK